MVIIDTSVAIKLYFPEEGSPQALSLVEGEEVGAPDLLLYEFSNYLVNRQPLTKKEVDQAIKLLVLESTIQFFAPLQKVLEWSIDLARHYSLSAYDASFVALAESLNLDFVTADEKLVKKVKSLSFVHLL